MFQKILQLIIWKKTGLTGVLNFFSVDFNPIDTNDILDIHKYLMKRTWYKIMFGLIKKIFIGLLTGLVNGSNHTKWVSLSNQKCEIQLTFTNLHPNENSQEFCYYPFSVKLDRWIEVVILLMTYLIKHVFQIKQKVETKNISTWLQE